MDSVFLRLGVNIDHVATLRQARGVGYPEPVHAALLAEQAGADGITAHLREDRRHIQDRDIIVLRQTIQTRLNLEMAVTPEMLEIACRIGPDACCLVPERRAELTTEGGLDVAGNWVMLREACARLADHNIEVSLFIDPEPAQIEAAVRAGAPVVELHTGCYAEGHDTAARQAQLKRIQAAARLARQAGLQVNAGHGLDYHNVETISRIPQLVELNIGHAIVARAVFTGLSAAVGEMKALMRRARGQSL